MAGQQHRRWCEDAGHKPDTPCRLYGQSAAAAGGTVLVAAQAFGAAGPVAVVVAVGRAGRTVAVALPAADAVLIGRSLVEFGRKFEQGEPRRSPKCVGKDA